MDKAEKAMLRALLRQLRDRQLLSPELSRQALELLEGERVSPHFLHPWEEERAYPKDKR